MAGPPAMRHTTPPVHPSRPTMRAQTCAPNALTDRPGDPRRSSVAADLPVLALDDEHARYLTPRYLPEWFAAGARMG